MDTQRREIAVALLKAGTAVLEGANPQTVIARLGDRLREVGLGPAPASQGSPGAAEAAGPTSAPSQAVRVAPARPQEHRDGSALVVAPAPAALVVDVRAPEAAPVARRPDPYKDDVLAVFEHWRTATGHTSAKLTPDRIQKVRARLREGYTVADLKAAIDGCCASPFHTGENDRATRYDDLTLICRTGSKVEHFRELAGPAAYTTPAPAPQRSDESIARENQIRTLKAQARELLKQGKTEEYADALRSIRALAGES